MRASSEAPRFGQTLPQRLAQGEEAYRAMLNRADAPPADSVAPTPLTTISDADKVIFSASARKKDRQPTLLSLGTAAALATAACSPATPPPTPNIEGTATARIATRDAQVSTPSTPHPAVTARKPETPTAKPRSTLARPTEAPKPKATATEKAIPIEQQAKLEALRYMLTLLSSRQEVEKNTYDKRKETLESIIENSGHFPLQLLAEGKPVPPDSDLLKIRWINAKPGTMFREHTDKIFGEARVKNIKTSLLFMPNVNDADRANGIQWKGVIVLEFISQHRVVKPIFVVKGYYFQGGTEKDWAATTIPSPTIDFTSWRPDNLQFPVELVNGRWNAGYRSAREIYYLRHAYGACFPIGGSGCQTIHIKME